MANPADLAKAKSAALRLIKFRLRSEHEVREKLADKSFSPEAIDLVVGLLKKSGLLDDALFARLWAESRVKKPFGPRRLRYELKKKGIDKALIDETLERVFDQYSQEDAIRDLISRKSQAMRSLDPARVRARLYGLLSRRGFPQDKVMEALRDMIKTHEETDD